jgi:hypothetical protein
MSLPLPVFLIHFILPHYLTLPCFCTCVLVKCTSDVIFTLDDNQVEKKAKTIIKICNQPMQLAWIQKPAISWIFIWLLLLHLSIHSDIRGTDVSISLWLTGMYGSSLTRFYDLLHILLTVIHINQNVHAGCSTLTTLLLLLLLQNEIKAKRER